MTMSTFVDNLVKIPEEMKVLFWFYQNRPLVPAKYRTGILPFRESSADGPIVTLSRNKIWTETMDIKTLWRVESMSPGTKKQRISPLWIPDGTTIYPDTCQG